MTVIYGTHLENDNIFRCFFFIFFKFWFSVTIGWGGRGGERGKNGPEWQKNSVCHARYLRNHRYMSFMVKICEIIICTGVSFNFKILIFQAVRGLKGQKMAPYILGTIYHIIFIYGTHVCIKRWYHQAFFFFIFWNH